MRADVRRCVQSSVLSTASDETGAGVLVGNASVVSARFEDVRGLLNIVSGRRSSHPSSTRCGLLIYSHSEDARSLGKVVVFKVLFCSLGCVWLGGAPNANISLCSSCRQSESQELMGGHLRLWMAV